MQQISEMAGFKNIDLWQYINKNKTIILVHAMTINFRGIIIYS